MNSYFHPMRWYQWILTWVLTVLVGSVPMSLAMDSDFELYIMVVAIAAICGSPTLIAVLGVNEYLRRKSVPEVHRSQLFLWHVGIGVINLIVLFIIQEAESFLIAVAAACYAPIGFLLTYAVTREVFVSKDREVGSVD